MGLISVSVNNSGWLLYLWAIRNYGRFFLWFFCCVELIDLSQWEKHIKNLNIFMYLNFAIMLYQFFVEGERSDYLNGLFGRYVGGNSAINTFLILLTIENFAALLTKKRELKKVFLNILVMGATCALNEIKIFFIEIIFVAIIGLWCMRKKRQSDFIRIMGITVTFAILSICSLVLFLTFYPNYYEKLNLEYWIYYSTRSLNSSDLIYHNDIPVANRLTVYKIVYDNFLTDVRSKLIGIGMGAADTSVFIFNEFYNKFAPVLYGAFLFGIVLLEDGIIGLGLCVAFFMYIAVDCKKKGMKMGNKYYSTISLITSLLGILLCVYNSALKIETSGYIYYTFLAIGYAANKSKLYTKE